VAACALLGVLAPAAWGGGGPTALVEGDVTGALEVGSFNLLFDGVEDHYISGDQLREIHDALAEDGIETAGCITSVLVDFGEGLSVLTLLDGFLGDTDGRSRMRVNSTAPAHAGYRINDLVDDVMVDPGGLFPEELEGNEGEYGDQTLSGTFRWIEGRGDAFSWSNLQVGDTITYDFRPIDGLIGEAEAPFKFVTYVDGAWTEVASAGVVSDDDHLRYSITIIPTPGVLALLGIAGLVGTSRRRC
jgi:hypothetical protein